MPSSVFELTGPYPVTGKALTKKAVKAAADEATTLTAAETINGIVTMTPSTGRALTTPTGAELATELGAGFEIGSTFELTVVNVAAATHAITFTDGGDGITFGGVAGMATVAAASSATYVFYCTAVSTPAFTVYRK